MRSASKRTVTHWTLCSNKTSVQNMCPAAVACLCETGFVKRIDLSINSVVLRAGTQSNSKLT